MTAAFLDSSVLVLSAGGEDPDRASARGTIEAAIAGHVDLHVSVTAIPEFVHHRMLRGPASALEESRMLRHLCVLHPFDDRVLDKALELIDSTSMRGRDAVHAATAILAGFDRIVSADRDFESLPDVRLVSPSEWHQA